MPASIGVNLRVTGHCRQGGRKYMEDFFSVAYQQTEDDRDLEYAFFGIYDGHGGAEAAAFAKEHLMETIIKHKSFWSDNDEDVLRAIKNGYIATHYAMWREQENWPKTASGLPSTAGTTASVAFIRRGKIYIGHVGDSGIILGYQENGSSEWRAKALTRDHKPENAEEMTRINQCGGKVVSKSGVPRVVWNRPKMGHQGPVRRSTPIDEIPFLAVARSLGDLWSYNYQHNQFIVSPDPDISVITIDPDVHRCLVFGTDGLFNMLSPQSAVHLVQHAERHNESAALSDDCINKTWLNPSKLLVEKALERWQNTKMRADNTSVVTLMLDPPGPPRVQVLKNRIKNASYPDSGLKIMTRFEDEPQLKEEEGETDCDVKVEQTTSNEKKNCESSPQPPFLEPEDRSASNNTSLYNINNNNNNQTIMTEPEAPSPVTSSGDSPIIPATMSNSPVPTTAAPASSSFPLKERNNYACGKLRESTSFDPRETEGKENSLGTDNDKEQEQHQQPDKDRDKDASIQINEISSSSMVDFNDNDCGGGDDENADFISSQTTAVTSRHNLRSSCNHNTNNNNSNNNNRGIGGSTANKSNKTKQQHHQNEDADFEKSTVASATPITTTTTTTSRNNSKRKLCKCQVASGEEGEEEEEEQGDSDLSSPPTKKVIRKSTRIDARKLLQSSSSTTTSLFTTATVGSASIAGNTAKLGPSSSSAATATPPRRSFLAASNVDDASCPTTTTSTTLASPTVTAGRKSAGRNRMGVFVKQKLSLTQKILKSKKLVLKKQRQRLARKKLKEAKKIVSAAAVKEKKMKIAAKVTMKNLCANLRGKTATRADVVLDDDRRSSRSLRVMLHNLELPPNVNLQPVCLLENLDVAQSPSTAHLIDVEEGTKLKSSEANNTSKAMPKRSDVQQNRNRRPLRKL